MEFRLAEEKDMVRVITLINQAKQFLAQQNVDQWQNGYPNAASIQEDFSANCRSSQMEAMFNAS